jgi:predicted nucleic acid-binding protein
MGKIVVDSSVAIKWFVVESYSIEARRILNEYQMGALTLLAPDLINAEVGNVVWKKHLFQGLATVDAQQIIVEFLELKFVLVSTATLLNEAYHLAVTHQRTVYDALYMALSVHEQCPYVTADEKLFNAIKGAFPKVMWVANWPQSIIGWPNVPGEKTSASTSS